MQLATQPQNEAKASPALIKSTRMSLAHVKRGRIEKPYRVVLYGPEGVGKSTFGAGATGAIFLGAEDGTSELDVSRMPEPKTWTDALDAIDELRAGKHDFGALIVDTLDWLEPLCWTHVCESGVKKLKSIEDAGYGKGYVAALDLWRVFLGRLNELRDTRGMHIVLLAHSQIRTFRNPEDEDFDRYEMKLNAKAGALIREWCDALLFTNYETLAYEKDGRVRGVGTGARFIHTQRRPAFDAKNRQGLPEKLPLAWDDFLAAAKTGAPVAEETLRTEITALLNGMADETVTKVTAAMANADATKLALIADRLRAKAETSNTTNTETK